MKAIRVLVVEDETIVREGVVSMLSFQSDINVVGQAKDGQEAIVVANQEKPDVILLDLAMPRLDGLSSISRLREVSPNTKILILTGYPDPEKVFRAIKAGAIGYLLKDSTWEQLLHAIRDVSNGRSYIDPSIALKVIQEINPTSPSPAQINHSLVLTKRETQTLALLAKGLSNQEIGEQLFVHERTIAKYVGNILDKLQLANRTQAALYAIHEGLDKEQQDTPETKVKRPQ